MNQSKLLGLVALALVSCSVACTTPEANKVDSERDAMTLKNSHSYRISASSSTKAKLGIATWHVLTQGEAGATVLEGVDASGNVKFATAFRRDPQVDAFHIEGFRGVTGRLTVTKVGDEYKTTNTLALDKWNKYAAAFGADGDEEEATVEYGKKKTTKTTKGQKKPTGVFKKVVETVKKVGKKIVKRLGQLGKIIEVGKDIYDAGKEIYDMINGPEEEPKTDLESFEEGEDPEAEVDADEEQGDEDPAVEDDEETLEDEADPEEDDDFDAEADVEDEGDVSAEEFDDELDEDGGDDDSEEDFEESGDDDDGEEDADEGGDDDDSGDADEGGDDDDSEFALHNRCGHLSCSATTKVCICAKY